MNKGKRNRNATKEQRELTKGEAKTIRKGSAKEARAKQGAFVFMALPGDPGVKQGYFTL